MADSMSAAAEAAEARELDPDAVVCTGDLTNEGYRQEYKNWVAYSDRIKAPVYTVTGNHDARNVGYLVFEDTFGTRDSRQRLTCGGLEIALVAVDERCGVHPVVDQRGALELEPRNMSAALQLVE